MTIPMFRPEDFTATQWDTAADKARFANHFVRFVTGGYRETVFQKTFYRRLSMMFGHIAHYNRDGFYGEWFSTSARRARFLENVRDYASYGDPAHTYGDVERVLRAWVQENPGLIEMHWRAHRDAVTTADLAELARLKAKYPDHK